MQFEKAAFAGGCFWCMVKPFDQWDGVHKVISGYTGGHIENPTYEIVKEGNSGHYEAVEITYNPEVISYDTILNIYWQQIDPTDDGGQFHDRGDSYRTAIFYHTDEQKQQAEQTKKELEKSGRFSAPIVTKILPADRFYTAEDYHQDYYKKNEKHYKEDREKSGRDKFIQSVWK
jgi:peptide-methionine (S)-S-oxide reductase